MRASARTRRISAWTAGGARLRGTLSLLAACVVVSWQDPGSAAAALGARLVELHGDCSSSAFDGWFEGEAGVVAGARGCGWTPTMWTVGMADEQLVATETHPVIDGSLELERGFGENTAVAACRGGVVGNLLLKGSARASFTFLDGVPSTSIGEQTLASVSDDCSRIVGFGPVEPGGALLPLSWSGDKQRTLPLPPGFTSGRATHVARHAAARVLGTATTDAGRSQAVRWRRRIATTLPLPEGYASCQATGFSADGRFAVASCAMSEEAATRLPFLYSGVGTPVPLPYPPQGSVRGTDPVATAVTTSDGEPHLIVGSMWTGETRMEGLLWVNRGGRWQVFTAAEVINAQELSQNDFRGSFLSSNLGYWDVVSVDFVATEEGTVLGGSMRLYEKDWPHAIFSGYLLTLPPKFRVRSANVIPSSMVDSDDVALVRACKEAGAPLSEECTRADFDADGDVDRRDMAWVRSQRCTPHPQNPYCS